MTVLAGRFVNVAGEHSQGEVRICSIMTRPSGSHPGEMVTREVWRGRLDSGGFVSPELDAGPVVVELIAGGCFESWRISVPAQGRHELADLLETRVVWEPAVIGRVEAAAQAASRSATAAGKSATAAKTAEARVVEVIRHGAGAVRGELAADIAAVATARDAAQASATTAKASETAAGASATQAKQSETTAGAAATAAKASESAAGASATGAKASATAAGASATAAKASESAAASGAGKAAEAAMVAQRSSVAASASATDAAGSATAAKAGATAAGASATSAGQSASGAKQSATMAASAAAGAKTSATTATQAAADAAAARTGAEAAQVAAATGAETAGAQAKAADRAAGTAATSAAEARTSETNAAGHAAQARQAAASAETSAPEAGWPRASLDQDVRDSLTRADQAVQVVPRATAQAPGAVQLAGDLGGTAAAPTVPGLAGKMDKQAVSDKATAGSLVRRTPGGQVTTSAPTAGGHAASKGYVDEHLAGKAATRHTHTSADITDAQSEISPGNAGKLLTAVKVGADAVMSMGARARFWIKRGAMLQVQSGGELTIEDAPVQGKDAANKDYVDARTDSRAPVSHTHTSADITDSTSTVAPANGGKLLHVRKYSNDRAYLDLEQGGSIWIRDGGRLVVADTAEAYINITPTADNHFANKAYVDSAAAAPAWRTDQVTVKDNGVVSLGAGGRMVVKWRVHHGVFDLYYEIVWGDRPRSAGGDVRLILPTANGSGMKAIGTGTYWSQGDRFNMAALPEVLAGSNQLKVLVTRHGSSTLLDPLRIWDGKNGAGTGKPVNPGFMIDQKGSSIAGHISFPV